MVGVLLLGLLIRPSEVADSPYGRIVHPHSDLLADAEADTIEDPMMNFPLLSSLILLWSTMTLFAGGGRNRVTGDVLEIPYAAEPITIDGNLQEWDPSDASELTLASRRMMPPDAKEVPLSPYGAKISFKYNNEALLVAVWWKDPTPLGPETSPACTPPGDGFILSIPLSDGMHHLAIWRKPGGKATMAVQSIGDSPLSKGVALRNVKQAYKVTGKNTYQQETSIPWSELGGKFEPGQKPRIGVELCFGGLDPASGYKAWHRDMNTRNPSSENRWGGGMCWGFVDGIALSTVVTPGTDPNRGAEVKCLPEGSVSEPNPPIMFMGNEQTRTTKLIAVPAKKSATKGERIPLEWDEKSGTVISSEPTLFPGRYATKVFFAYDADGLTIRLRAHTDGPHLNVNSPDSTGHGYDGGDAIQIRLGIGKRVTSVDAWYYDKEKKPHIVLTYGSNIRMPEKIDWDAIANGARMTFKQEMGGGYTQEIFFPWSMIAEPGQILRQGDSFRAIFDLFYSGLAGNRIPFILNTKVLPPAKVTIPAFTAPRDAFYSAVIVDGKGTNVRRLLTLKQLHKGEGVTWDGCGDDEALLPPGDYAFKALSQTGIGLKYLTSYNNPGTAPTRDEKHGDWGGDNTAAQSVAADKNGVYIAWPESLDNVGVIGCDLSGHKRWGTINPVDHIRNGTGILSSDGRNLYFAQEMFVPGKTDDNESPEYKTILTCLSPTSGKPDGFMASRFSSAEISRTILPRDNIHWWWDLYNSKRFSLDTYGIHGEFVSEICFGVNLSGFVAHDGRLYFSSRRTNEILVYDAGTFSSPIKDDAEFFASLKPLHRWKVAKPGGLAFSPDGVLYSISDRSVVTVAPSGELTPFVAGPELSSPVALAFDKSGSLYISDWGDAQCVKVFSKTGTFSRTIGTLGGRPWVGKYDPKGMLLPRGIAVDSENKLWVAEDDAHPHRVSVWNTETGELIKELIGGTYYSGRGGGQIDPRNPNHALSNFGTLFKINLDHEGYSPLSTLWRRTSLNACFRPLRGYGNGDTRFHDIAGKRFIISSDYGLGCLIVSELVNNTFLLPRVAIGSAPANARHPLFENPAASHAMNAQKSLYPEFLYGHPDENYIWTDLNGDGLVQAEEMQWQKKTAALPLLGGRLWPEPWGTGSLDSQHNLLMRTFTDESIIRLPFQGLTQNGVPKYDFNHTETAAKSERMGSASCAATGEVITSCPARFRPQNAADKSQSSLIVYAKDGTKRWTWPASRFTRPSKNIDGTSILGPFIPPGEAGEVFALSQFQDTDEAYHVPLITTDGLLVARLLRDPAEVVDGDRDWYDGEFEQCLSCLDNGRLILSCGKNTHQLFGITGMETIRRFEGTLKLPPAPAAGEEEK